ncbi:hypothetical protein KIPB_005237 [Kipferlia bialata]|uniref:Uncharacterized protein n=1 Tax=Kipferlia bialata TaxID=797122 RepID=A0A391NW33_9EUKA|nr:hypothetical protein KIPB_005237 [Kipferlia bialata]|eukprot:g5237.t1
MWIPHHLSSTQLLRLLKNKSTVGVSGGFLMIGTFSWAALVVNSLILNYPEVVHIPSSPICTVTVLSTLQFSATLLMFVSMWGLYIKGSFSIRMLCYTIPGCALSIFYLVWVAKQTWSSYLSFVIGGVQQLVLLSCILYYKYMYKVGYI